MEQYESALAMLDLMTQPAFCVRRGNIIKVNPAAAALLIENGTDIQTLLHTGAEEYAQFHDGCLYLILSISGQQLGASVSRIQDLDIFCFDSEDTDARLQALSLAARELRAPLSGIMAVADKFLPEAAAENPNMQDQAATLYRGLFQLLRIVGNMSDANRYAAAAGSRQEVRDICAVLDEVFSRASVLTEHTGVCLRYSGCPKSIFTLLDAQKLERMVFNIISNAVKFTPAGGTIDAKLTCRGKKLYLSVCDSGSGIPEALERGLFTRYSRAPALEDSRQGLGLGMVLIRSTAALHGGTVLVDHPENAGTRITVSLSIRQADAALRCPMFHIDYAGERDHGLIELSDVLPAGLYDPDAIN